MGVFIIVLSVVFIGLEVLMLWYLRNKLIRIKKLTLKDTVIYPFVVLITALTLIIAKIVYMASDFINAFTSSLKDSVSIVALSLNMDVVNTLLKVSQSITLDDVAAKFLLIVYFIEYFISILALISISLSLILVASKNMGRRLKSIFKKYEEIDYIFGFNEDAKQYIKNYYNEFILNKKIRSHKTYVILDNSNLNKHEDEKFYLDRYKMPFLERPYSKKADLEKIISKYCRKVKKYQVKFLIFIDNDKLLFDFVNQAQKELEKQKDINENENNIEFIVVANIEQERFLNNLINTNKLDRKAKGISTENDKTDIIDSSDGRIRIVNKYDLIANEFVQNHNFAKYLEPSLLNDDLTVNNCDINIYVLGFGKVNQAVLRDVLVCNQFVEKIEENKLILKAKRMNVIVYDDNKNVNCFELINGLFKYDKESYVNRDYLDLPEDYLHYREIKSDFSIYSKDFVKELFEHINKKCKEKNQMNYFLISIDDDFTNSDIAVKLRNNYDHIECQHKDKDGNLVTTKAYNCFFIRNQNDEYDQKYGIYTYGSNRDVLRYDNVVGQTTINMAKKYDKIYNDLAGKADESYQEYCKSKDKNYTGPVGFEPNWSKDSPMKRKSNIYSVFSIYFKLSLLATLALKKAKKENDDTSIKDIDLSKIVTELLNYNCKNISKNDDFEKFYEYSIDEKKNFAIRDVLAFIEHEKWNAYELSQGVLPMSKTYSRQKTLENDKNRKIYKTTEDELYHLALTSSKGLRDYYDFINKLKEETGYKGDPDIIKYDYYHMDIICKDLLENEGKEFKEIYDNLISYFQNDN